MTQTMGALYDYNFYAMDKKEAMATARNFFSDEYAPAGEMMLNLEFWERYPETKVEETYQQIDETFKRFVSFCRRWNISLEEL